MNLNDVTELPRIFHFNPTCEIAIANKSPYYNPPQLLAKFEEELAPLMLFFANDGDHLIKNEDVDDNFKRTLDLLGISQVNLINKEKLVEQIGLQTVGLNPWGWSPAEANFLLAFNPTSEQKIQINKLTNSDLFERKHAIQLLKQLIKEYPSALFPSEKQLPRMLKTVNEVDSFLQEKQQIVLKSPLSSSGRGLQVIRKNQLNTSNIQWANTNLKQQKYLIGEPLFDKKADLSFQFEVKNKNEIAYHGISQFKTNKNGQYLGHYLNPLPAQLNSYVGYETLIKLAQSIQRCLEKSIFANYYRGFLSVDALIYQEGTQLKIQPCLEINPRYNMGILSKYIEQKIHPESIGQFEVYYNPKQGFKEFIEIETKKNHPTIEDQLLRKGFIALTSPSISSNFGAYIRLF